MSYRTIAAREPGAVANIAEKNKFSKYRELESRFIMQPIAIETLGVIGQSTLTVLRELGRRIEVVTGDRRATEFLLQRVSMEV